MKTAGGELAQDEQRVSVRRSSFRAHPSTFVCVVGWDRRAREFEPDCLLIPSAEVFGLAREEGDWLLIELEPAARSHRRLDRYRALASLGGRVESLLTGVVGLA